MVTSCCVVGCTNRDIPGNGISFFRFPKKNSRHSSALQKLSFNRRKSWIHAVNRKATCNNVINYDAMRICSSHFRLGKPSHVQDINNADWTPSLRMGYQTKAEKENVERSKRQDRWIKRNTNLNEPAISDEQELASSITQVGDVMQNLEANVTQNSGVENLIQNTLDVQEDNESTDAMRNTIVSMQNPNTKHSLPFTEETFAGDNEKLKFYTGIINMELFQFILSHLKPSLAVLRDSPLTSFQMLLLTLMKLKLDDPFTRLGYDFGISQYVAGKIFRKVVVLITYLFKNIIHWPTENAIKRSTPKSFLDLQQQIGMEGKTVRVIIDCFEIKAEKAANNKGKSQMFSSYKHYYTLKYLIGVTPFGLISFISNGWGGRTSDTEITEKSNFLNLLDPGDVVLADRGFGTSVSKLIKKRNAILVTPAFTQNKKQFHPTQVEATRTIACRRIHVERVIGQLRNKFKILCGPVPITILEYEFDGDNLFDHVVRACCIICNLSDPIVRN